MSNVLRINSTDIGRKYPEIGRGDEGVVYNYDNLYALKIFTYYKNRENVSKLKRKLAKIEMMSSLDDRDCAFPLGLVSLDGKSIDGCYSRFVNSNSGRKDFNSLSELKDIRRKIQYLVKADSILQRLHNMDVVVGDIKEDNIMIDKDSNPVYIDADNYAYRNYLFDLIPTRAGCLYSMFGGKSLALKDNDKLVFAIMALRLLTGDEDTFSHYRSGDELKKGLNEIFLNQELKEVYNTIFSDSLDKPYVGPYLKKVLH